MQFSKRATLPMFAGAILLTQTAFISSLRAETKPAPVERWSVQVDAVNAGDVNIAPEFKVAIYEDLLKELAKTKQFSTVLRSGDRNATGLPKLLILKTTVESYSPGSEAKRAVTTVAGATKLKVRTQLLTREGEVVLERVVDGNVRFFGGNLRATHNLAHNLSKVVQKSALPAPGPVTVQAL